MADGPSSSRPLPLPVLFSGLLPPFIKVWYFRSIEADLPALSAQRRKFSAPSHLCPGKGKRGPGAEEREPKETKGRGLEKSKSFGSKTYGSGAVDVPKASAPASSEAKSGDPEVRSQNSLPFIA